MVIHTLFSGGPESAQGADIGLCICRPNNDEPVRIAERIKRLGPQRMPFHHLNFYRMGAGLAAEDADQWRATVGLHIDTGEIVEPVCRSFIDGEVLRTVGFDDVTERGKGFPRQRCGEKFERIQN
jgi:hypothetical protein